MITTRKAGRPKGSKYTCRVPSFWISQRQWDALAGINKTTLVDKIRALLEINATPPGKLRRALESVAFQPPDPCQQVVDKDISTT